MTVCVRCGTELSKGHCLTCAKIYRRKYYSANREKILAKAKVFQAAHAEQIKARSAAYRAANPERMRAQYKKTNDKNREKRNAYDKKRRLEHREELNAAQRERRWKNLEKYKAMVIRWQKANPEAMRLIQQNRRARIKFNGGKLSPGIIDKLFQLQKGKCACCGKPLGKGFHLDHRMPLVLGGEHADSNMQLLTQRCNNEKRSKHPVDFMQSRGFLL